MKSLSVISPNGKFLVAGGEDSRIRVWRLISTDQPTINPILFTRFAHEGALHLLRFSEDGRLLVSAGADGTVKLWETEFFQQVHSWPKQPAPAQALSISSAAGLVAVGRMDGSVQRYPLPVELHALGKIESKQPSSEPIRMDLGVASQLVESEPNDSPEQAQMVRLPVRVKGLIHSPTTANGSDVDLFRFAGKAGQQWIFEVVAARNESKLDSHLEVLDSQGDPIPRVVLQATYESYFTFRGKDSMQTGDYRLHNWEDLRLNQYLFCNGEVVRFYHYPRGPDSGFNVYPDFDKRHAFFGTTPLTHPLNESCYVVEPHRPGTPIVPNGLPTFTVNYENDDDSLRRFGDDSYLSFVTPADGEYLVRVADVRGGGRSDFQYELVARSPKPDFGIVSIMQEKGEVMAGTGYKFGVTIKRDDGFDGPVAIHFEGLPAGFLVSTPLIVQAGQLRAYGTIFAESDAVAPSEQEASRTKLIAVTQIDGRELRKWPYGFGKITLKPQGELQVELAPHQDNPPQKDGLPVIEITAGTTTTFVVRAIRNGYKGRVSFGNQDAAYNAPHGIYVDNIGLKGMQLQENETQRSAYLTAEPWVEPQDRIIFVEAEEAGRPASSFVWLRVLRPNR